MESIQSFHVPGTTTHGLGSSGWASFPHHVEWGAEKMSLLGQKKMKQMCSYKQRWRVYTLWFLPSLQLTILDFSHCRMSPHCIPGHSSIAAPLHLCTKSSFFYEASPTWCLLQPTIKRKRKEKKTYISQKKILRWGKHKREYPGWEKQNKNHPESCQLSFQNHSRDVSQLWEEKEKASQSASCAELK